MARKPLIGITAGEAQNKYYPTAPKVYGQQHTYVEAIERAGGTPLIIPIVEDADVLRHLYSLCDGLVLAGGNDIDPAIYQAKRSPHTNNLHKERDKQEMQLWAWADDENMSVLAICRGMQIVNVGRGGTLIQDIPTELPDADNHRIDADKYQDREHQIVHQLDLKKDSLIKDIIGTSRVGANSYHHQAIKDLGQGLLPSAWSEDGLIEGVEMHDKRFVVGVQSHPEALEADIEPRWRTLFQAFVSATAS